MLKHRNMRRETLPAVVAVDDANETALCDGFVPDVFRRLYDNDDSSTKTHSIRLIRNRIKIKIVKIKSHFDLSSHILDETVSKINKMHERLMHSADRLQSYR